MNHELKDAPIGTMTYKTICAFCKPVGNIISMRVVMIVLNLLLLTVISCSTIEKRAESWDLENTVAETAWQGFHYWDYTQTMNIAHHPDRYHELNPTMPEHPSEKDVNEFFAATSLVHAGVSFLLPEKANVFMWKVEPRKYWQYISIGTKAGTVFWNIQVMGFE